MNRNLDVGISIFVNEPTSGIFVLMNRNLESVCCRMLESNSLSGTLDLKGEDTSILTYIDVSNNRITGLEDGDYDLGSNGESYRLM